VLALDNNGVLDNVSLSAPELENLGFFRKKIDLVFYVTLLAGDFNQLPHVQLRSYPLHQLGRPNFAICGNSIFWAIYIPTYHLAFKYRHL